MNRKPKKQARKIALLLIFTTFFSSVAIACFSVHDALNHSATIEIVSDEQAPVDAHSLDVHCHTCTSHFSCHMNGMLTNSNLNFDNTDSLRQFYLQFALKNRSIVPPIKPPRV